MKRVVKEKNKGEESGGEESKRGENGGVYELLNDE